MSRSSVPGMFDRCSRSTLIQRALALGVLTFAGSNAAVAQMFTDVSAAAGLTHVGETYGAAWGDINGDGYPDIFVSNHRDQPELYINSGLGTFVPTHTQVYTWTQRPGADTHGGTFADINNDGQQDLMVTIGRNPNGTLQQFLINDRGALINKTVEYNVIADNWGGRTPVWFDGNRDGQVDLMVAMFGNSGQVLQQNNGVYSNITSANKFQCFKFYYGQLFDVNNDGRLDLMCSGEAAFPQKAYDTTPTPYSNITAKMPSVLKVTDTAIGDFNNDLRQDIFYTRGTLRTSSVAQYGTNVVEAFLTGGIKGFYFVSPNKLNVQLDWNQTEEGSSTPLIKIGAGGTKPPAIPFTLDPNDPNVLGEPVSDVTEYPIIHIWYDPLASTWHFQHLNGKVAGSTGNGFSDGYFVVTSEGTVTKLKSTGLWATDKAVAPALVMNYSGGYVEDSLNWGVSDPIQCASVVPGDFNNDMYLDLYLVCRTGASNLENILLLNDGNGHFVKQTGAGGAPGPVGAAISSGAGTGDSVAVADYNADGFLDLFVTNGLNMRPVGAGGPDKLYRNNGNANHWIELELVGTGSSTRDAIGARVYATANGVTQLREQNGGYHRWSQNDRRIHFGLAGATKVDLKIVWPNGVTELHNNVTTNKLYKVTQGSGIAVRTPGDALPYPCGTPSYDGTVDNGVVMWRDCNTGTWKLRMMSGNASKSVHFVGSLSSTADFVAVTPFNLNATYDVLDVTPSLLSFDFSTAGGAVDGVSVDLAPGAGTCFDVSMPPGAIVQYGLFKKTVTPPFDMHTLQPCTPAVTKVSINDVTVNESNSKATMTVSLAAAASATVSVDVSTQDGTAVAGSDFTALAPTTVTFAPGETSKNVSISILNDAIPELTETFDVVLSNPVNATIQKGTGTVTINDNEFPVCGAPSFSAGTEQAIFVWRDCPSDTWHVRITSGGAATTVTNIGTLHSDQAFASLTGYSIEATSDVLDTSVAGQLSYKLKMNGTGVDGFDVTFAPGSLTCFAPTSPAIPVLFGSAKTAASVPVDLTTMGACTIP